MLFEAHKAEAVGGCLGWSSISFSTWRGEGLMLPPEKWDSESQGQWRRAHLCTAGSGKSLPWAFILTLSLQNYLKKNLPQRNKLTVHKYKDDRESFWEANWVSQNCWALHQECPVIITVKIRLLGVTGAGGALRQEGIPPSLGCGSLGSVNSSVSPAGGEAGHPASCSASRRTEGFSNTLLSTGDTWANLSSPGSHWHSSSLADCGLHTQTHTKGLSTSGFWTHSPSSQTLVSFSCWHLDLQ